MIKQQSQFPAEPEAVSCLKKNLDHLLPFLNGPKEHWRKMRTTNAVERAFRDIRRRTIPMSCLQNPNSVDRIIYGVTAHLDNNWKAEPLAQFAQQT